MALRGLSWLAVVFLVAAMTLSICSVTVLIGLLSASEHPTSQQVPLQKSSIQRDVSPSEENTVSGSETAAGIAIHGFPWYAMGMELEMQPKIGLNVSLADAGKLAREALLRQSCAAAGFCTESREVELQTLLVHDHEKIRTTPPNYWTLHEESDPGPLYELVSPWLLQEVEASLGVQVSQHLSHHFAGGRFASLHIHVDGRSLLKQGGSAIVSLLLLWETFHSAFTAVVSHRPSAGTYGPSFQEKHPTLLAALQNFWITEQQSGGRGSQEASIERLVELFELHHDTMFERKQKGVLAGIPNRNGYRNFAVNVCHLLQIRCCRQCNKNMAPKHGLIEFRVFDVVYGQKLLILLQIVQRIMQLLCCERSHSLEGSCKREQIEKYMLLPGKLPSKDLSDLLDLVEVEKESFYALFAAGSESGS